VLAGDYEDRLDPIAADGRAAIEADKRIVVSGWVDDIRPYPAASAGLVFPSRREGFPMERLLTNP